MGENTTTNDTMTDAEIAEILLEMGLTQTAGQTSDCYTMAAWAVDEYRIVIESFTSSEGDIWTIYHEGEQIIEGAGGQAEAFRAFIEAGE